MTKLDQFKTAPSVKDELSMNAPPVTTVRWVQRSVKGGHVPNFRIDAFGFTVLSPPVPVARCTSCGGVLEDGLHWCDGAAVRAS